MILFLGRLKGTLGPRLVLACGCFDVLTVGHVRHFKAARKLGNSLCVLVTADRHVCKGEGRPLFPEEVRAEVVDALGCVDYTVLNPYPTAVEAIRLLRPSVFVKGGEYREKWVLSLQREAEEVHRAGGRLEFTNERECHTTEVLRRLGL